MSRRPWIAALLAACAPAPALAGTSRISLPGVITLCGLFALLLWLRSVWRRATGQVDAPADEPKSSRGAGLVCMALGALGALTALLGRVLGPQGGGLWAVVGEVLPWAGGMFAFGAYLVWRDTR